MAIKLIGNAGAAANVAEVEANHRALRTQQRPIDVGTLGSYRKAMLSGTIAAGLAGDSPLFSFRYSGANLCIPRKVIVSAGDLVGFTAGFFNLSLMAARSFSASDSGGTAGAITGNNGKLRASMGTTGVGDIRMATTGALTPGTRTLDTDPIGTFSTSVITTAGLAPLPNPVDLLDRAPDEWPLILAQNEGFVIHATVPATGTWKLGVMVAWDEVTTASWAQGA